MNELGKTSGIIGSWIYVNYEEIANRINTIASSSNSKAIKEHIEQIEEYCEIIKCINIVLDENINRYKNLLTYDCDYKSLDNLRIADVFKKHKGSNFLNYIKSRRDELDPMTPKGFKLKINQNFTNSKVTLDVRFSNFDDDNGYKKPYYLLGVQIEGSQFRILAEKNARFGGGTADEIYNEFKNIWFDDSYDKKLSRFIFGEKTAMKPYESKKYDSYHRPEEYCFVYQYFDITDNNNSYESLFEMIKEYIYKASKVLEKL